MLLLLLLRSIPSRDKLLAPRRLTRLLLGKDTNTNIIKVNTKEEEEETEDNKDNIFKEDNQDSNSSKDNNNKEDD